MAGLGLFNSTQLNTTLHNSTQHNTILCNYNRNCNKATNQANDKQLQLIAAIPLCSVRTHLICPKIQAKTKTPLLFILFVVLVTAKVIVKVMELVKVKVVVVMIVGTIKNIDS